MPNRGIGLHVVIEVGIKHYEYDFAMQASGKPDAKAAKIAIAEVSCYHG